MLPSIDKDLLISAPNRGKPVSFAPIYKKEAQLLKRAAREYYYPMMALKHLAALSSGLTGKDNVFIPNHKDFKTNSFQEVIVYVPGIKATVERRPNDSLVVTHLELDETYMESIAKKSNDKPGVYSISDGGRGTAISTYKSNGRIKPQDARNVVISSVRNSSVQDAVDQVLPKLGKLLGDRAAYQCDFDLFFSPVSGTLKGMKSYTPMNITQTYGFAGLLADAMERAKNQVGVSWVSDLDGSAVLAQGLQTLANKHVSFKGTGHLVATYLPTTNPTPLLRDAGKVDMLIDSKVAKGNGNWRAVTRSIITNAARARDKSDPFSWREYREQLSSGTMLTIACAGAATGTGSVFIGAPFLAAVSTFCGAAGAIQLACKAFSDGRNRR